MVWFRKWFLLVSISPFCAMPTEKEIKNKHDSKQIHFSLEADFITCLDLNVIGRSILKLGHLDKGLYRVNKRTLHEIN
jgi:hypothetical protein